MQSTYDFPGSGNFLNGACILETSNFPLSTLKDEHVNGELQLPLPAEHHSNIISTTTQRALLRLISTPLLDWTAPGDISRIGAEVFVTICCISLYFLRATLLRQTPNPSQDNNNNNNDVILVPRCSYFLQRLIWATWRLSLRRWALGCHSLKHSFSQQLK